MSTEVNGFNSFAKKGEILNN